MNVLNTIQTRASIRRAMIGVAALGLVTLSACGSDDPAVNSTPGTVFDTIAPVDNSAVDPAVVPATGDTVPVGSMPPETTVAP